MGDLRMPAGGVVARDYDQLKAIAFPGQAGRPQAIVQTFYDTQQYVSGTTVQLQFFQTQSGDKSLTNMPVAGQFQDGQWFSLHKLFLQIMNAPSFAAAATSTGQADDIARLLHTARAYVVFSLNQKSYPAIPAYFLGSAGGPMGTAESGVVAAPGHWQHGMNSNNGGFPVNGSIVIPPLTNFSMDLNFAAAQTLQGGNTYIQITMLGAFYRPVV